MLRRLLFLGVFCAVSLSAYAASDEGLHMDWLDKSVDPTQNFFAYANGGWQKANPIPADQSRWGTFNILLINNQKVLKDILEQDAKARTKHGSLAQKLGDFYATGMDEPGIEAAGIKPLQPELDAITAIHDQAS
ncbi:MAG TPA: M13 family metallopeptidase N-terminal domain-containing protein, partial [Gammaproteobacteria bacterium]|nr:M13 family metallopeptidase N-terminal domain-containing protein [Gammaproteobacteria bacterium]